MRTAILDAIGYGLVAVIIIVASFAAGYREGRADQRRERVDAPTRRTLADRLAAIERENGWRR